jgi:hypothetical protein
MSLRVVHIVFVASAILLSLTASGLLLSAYRRDGTVGTLLFGLFWAAAAALLTVYGRRVVRKLRSLSFR